MGFWFWLEKENGRGKSGVCMPFFLFFLLVERMGKKTNNNTPRLKIEEGTFFLGQG